MSTASGIDRRRFMQLAGLSGAAALAGCKQSESGGGDAARTLKIGYVSPKTGPLAGFAEADDFILNGVRTALKD
ncbi:MAG TPA: twin-arginine translocation signal domain-containing protein, partial [Actinomycetota bacterium]|nr:twin-arginine translocation signal domain-containing protein [Actinomycetota bacterium]